MCNAWNHPPDCRCGWGGDGHLGRSYGGGIGTPAGSAGYPWWVPAIQNVYQSFVNPNASCPVCGQSVFFYRSPDGGRVFFDELGPPWPKHPCTDSTSSPAGFNAKRSQPVRRFERYDWELDGWAPFFVTSAININPLVKKIRGSFEEEDLILYIRSALKNHRTQSSVTNSSLAHLRRVGGGTFDISVFTPSVGALIGKAFLRQATAQSAAGLRHMALTRRAKARIERKVEPVGQAPSAMELAFNTAKKKI
jgi:hypothetical protein